MVLLLRKTWVRKQSAVEQLNEVKLEKKNMIDLTNGVDISANGVEAAVSVVPPAFINTRDNTVEYAPNFPNMMYTLWGFICAYRRFPSQIEYTQHFLSVHSNILTALDEKAVKARLLRAFPSLIRGDSFLCTG